MGSFDESVWKLLTRIPNGKIATYKQLAIALGKPNAARAVGNACNRNPNAPRIPCHRVIKSDGSIGGYSKGVRKKIALLKSDGIEIRSGKVINLKHYLAKL